jgi:hypothetical protein
VTGDIYSLVEMKIGAGANNLTLVEYDLGLINADHVPELVIKEIFARGV